MTRLLDVNLLVALAWPSHVYDAPAHAWFAERSDQARERPERRVVGPQRLASARPGEPQRQAEVRAGLVDATPGLRSQAPLDLDRPQVPSRVADFRVGWSRRIVSTTARGAGKC